MPVKSLDTENIELKLLLDAIYMMYGYDFRGYARASVKRRVQRRQALSGLATLSDMQRELLYDEQFFYTLLQDMSINVTEMFRDPSFYLALRNKVLPELANAEVIKIWHAGCATGEEVYSMAILLKEKGLYDRSLIYATDFDETALAKASEGIYPLGKLQGYIKNYRDSGGIESFADYYTARYDRVLLDKSLKKNILFSNHNLVGDECFGEMNLIICRNVLIYFNRELQDRVFTLFRDSLCQNGILGLGSKETVRLSNQSSAFCDLIPDEKIYRIIAN